MLAILSSSILQRPQPVAQQPQPQPAQTNAVVQEEAHANAEAQGNPQAEPPQADPMHSMTDNPTIQQRLQQTRPQMQQAQQMGLVPDTDKMRHLMPPWMQQGAQPPPAGMLGGMMGGMVGGWPGMAGGQAPPVDRGSQPEPGAMGQQMHLQLLQQQQQQMQQWMHMQQVMLQQMAAGTVGMPGGMMGPGGEPGTRGAPPGGVPGTIGTAGAAPGPDGSTPPNADGTPGVAPGQPSAGTMGGMPGGMVGTVPGVVPGMGQMPWMSPGMPGMAGGMPGTMLDPRAMAQQMQRMWQAAGMGGAGPGDMHAPATDPHKVFASEVDEHTASLRHTHFDKYDTDADRVMSRGELAELVAAQEGGINGPVTAVRVEQWMRYYDLSNDGVVDPREWAYRVREDRLQQLVAGTDVDSDGQMSAVEMLAAGHGAAAVHAFMARHDVNGDGKLSASEILALHTHAEASASFRAHDTDEDGVISLDELGALQSNETVAAWFARYDIDRDGRVSLRDMAKVSERVSKVK